MKKLFIGAVMLCAVFALLNVFPAQANDAVTVEANVSALDGKIDALGIDRAVLGDKTTSDVVNFYVAKHVPSDKIAAFIEKDPERTIQFIAEAEANKFTDKEIDQYIDGILSTTSVIVGPGTPSNVIDNGDGTVTLPNGDVVAVPHYTGPYTPPPHVSLKDNGDGTVTLPNGDVVAVPHYTGPINHRPATTAKVTWNGRPLVFPDQQPINAQGRVLVPIRTLIEQLPSYEILMNQEKSPIIFTMQSAVDKDEHMSAQFTVGSTTYLFTDPATKEATAKALYAPLQVINGRTMISVRTVGELFGQVNWNGETQTVEIQTK